MSDPVMLGEAAKPQPTLTLDLAASKSGTVGNALRAGGTDVRLVDVTVEGASVTGFRIFVNKPDASEATPIEEASYAGSVAFFPLPVAGQPSGTFVIDIDPALERMVSKEMVSIDDPLTVTLVPIGAEDARIGLGSSELVTPGG
ncbi:MAG: hypothetical protein KDJ80_15175 [Nitratireductor sp.]|nr:hypothetical protein [Nitratireductor sp.]